MYLSSVEFACVQWRNTNLIQIIVVKCMSLWLMLIHISGVIKWVCLSIHTHTNPWGRLKWPYAITRLTVHFTCGLMYALVICMQRKEYGVHDNKHPDWDWVSLNNKNSNWCFRCMILEKMDRACPVWLLSHYAPLYRMLLLLQRPSTAPTSNLSCTLRLWIALSRQTSIWWPSHIQVYNKSPLL